LTVGYDGVSMLLLLLFAVGLPLLIAASINNDLHLRLARALRITRRTGKSSVWFDAFHKHPTDVVIDFADGRRLFGWPTFYSDDPSTPYIYLERPHWIVKSRFVDAGVSGILITPEEKIEFISFLKDDPGG
jgi:hypothetical protein